MLVKRGMRCSIFWNCSKEEEEGEKGERRIGWMILGWLGRCVVFSHLSLSSSDCAPADESDVNATTTAPRPFRSSIARRTEPLAADYHLQSQGDGSEGVAEWEC